jgi:predicted PurR-regulated permease PerM
MNEKSKQRMKYAIGFVVIVALILVAFIKFDSVLSGARFVMGLLTPLIVGCCIAFIVNVPMNAIERWLGIINSKRKKPVKQRVIEIISLILAIILMIFIFYLIIQVVVPNLAKSVVSIYNTAVGYVPKLMSFLREQGFDTATIQNWLDNINIDKLISTVTNNVKNIFSTITTAASSIWGVLFNTVTGCVLAIYILANKKRLGRQLKRVVYAFLKRETGDKICEVSKLSADTFSRFISGQCIECVILALMFLVVLSIMRFPYAGLISVIIGLLAVLPFVGAFLGCGLSALLILMVDPGKVLIFLLVFIIIQQVENQLIYPRVVGKSVGLPAMWTLLAALLGGKLFGILGLLFFIPLTSVLYTLFQRTVRERLKRKSLVVAESGGHVSEECREQETENGGDEK